MQREIKVNILLYICNDIMNYGCAAPLSVVEGGKGGAVPTNVPYLRKGWFSLHVHTVYTLSICEHIGTCMLACFLCINV